MPTKVTATVKIVAVERFEDINIHRPTDNVPAERLGVAPCGTIGVIEYKRMILMQDVDSGDLLQWFGKPSTKFWSAFSSKANNPLTEGSTATVVANVHKTKPADQHFGNRTVVQFPKLLS